MGLPKKIFFSENSLIFFAKWPNVFLNWNLLKSLGFLNSIAEWGKVLLAVAAGVLTRFLENSVSNTYRSGISDVIDNVTTRNSFSKKNIECLNFMKRNQPF